MTKSETKETPSEEKTDKPVNNAEGVQSQTVTELDRADEIVERQARENERREKILDREEALAARKVVGGVAEAGQETVKKEETNSDYTKKVMSGELNG